MPAHKPKRFVDVITQANGNQNGVVGCHMVSHTQTPYGNQICIAKRRFGGHIRSADGILAKTRDICVIPVCVCVCVPGPYDCDYGICPAAPCTRVAWIPRASIRSQNPCSTTNSSQQWQWQKRKSASLLNARMHHQYTNIHVCLLYYI